jgi:hypothetical protein
LVAHTEGGTWAVFENRMLRIFGPEMDKVTGDWRRPHNEVLYAVHSSPNIVQMIK